MRVPHRYQPLTEAELIVRPNRFVAEVRLLEAATSTGGRRARKGSRVTAHVPDPGRLKALLVPGARVWVGPSPAGSKRRTQWTVVMTAGPRGVRVCIDTLAANRLVARLLQQEKFVSELGLLEGGGGLEVCPETRVGKSRIDFLLQRGEERAFLEVKSVTLVEKRRGLFPDAPTTRGRRHLGELAELAQGTAHAGVLFVAQRADADDVQPHAGIDPDFAEAARRAADAGVVFRAVGVKVGKRGLTYDGFRPVVLC